MSLRAEGIANHLLANVPLQPVLALVFEIGMSVSRSLDLQYDSADEQPSLMARPVRALPFSSDRIPDRPV